MEGGDVGSDHERLQNECRRFDVDLPEAEQVRLCAVRLADERVGVRRLERFVREHAALFMQFFANFPLEIQNGVKLHAVTYVPNGIRRREEERRRVGGEEESKAGGVALFYVREDVSDAERAEQGGSAVCKPHERHDEKAEGGCAEDIAQGGEICAFSSLLFHRTAPFAFRTALRSRDRLPSRFRGAPLR